jgi:hypothetical protein
LYADILDVVGVLIAHRKSARRICRMPPDT